jgi:hypothetical protein
MLSLSFEKGGPITWQNGELNLKVRDGGVLIAALPPER